MLGTFKPVAFQPYGRRRAKRAPPRWLVLLVVGVALGAVGVLFVQESYLPPRLSAQESSELRTAYAQADAERQRLTAELGKTAKQLLTALSDKNGLEAQLATAKDSLQRLHDDVRALIAALPPDPRGGTVAVRAARLAVERGEFAYDVVLSRDAANGKLTGVVQFVLSGDSTRRPGDTLALTPIPISMGPYDSVRGSVPLPDGFRPKQATVTVLDRPNGKRLGLRVINVS